MAAMEADQSTENESELERQCVEVLREMERARVRLFDTLELARRAVERANAAEYRPADSPV